MKFGMRVLKVPFDLIKLCLQYIQCISIIIPPFLPPYFPCIDCTLKFCVHHFYHLHIERAIFSLSATLLTNTWLECECIATITSNLQNLSFEIIQATNSSITSHRHIETSLKGMSIKVKGKIYCYCL